MPRRLKPLITLEGVQASAAAPANHAALSASAGTGKTHVLTARVLRLLFAGADPGAILCLTFTKAGAAEMADRIHDRLAYWVRLKEQALKKELEALGERHGPAELMRARSLFAKVLEAPGGGLRIQTIHAFAQGLLAAFPVEADVTPGFRPLEGREQSGLVRTTLAEMLVQAEGGGDRSLVRDIQAMSLRYGEAAASDLMLACARVPDAMVMLGPREGIEARLRVAFGVTADDVEAAIEEGCGADLFDHDALEAVVEANRAWGTKTGFGAAAVIDAWRAAGPTERAATLYTLVKLVRTGKGTIKASSGQKKALADYGDHAERLAQCCERLLTLRQTAALVTLLAAGLRAGQAFAAAYADAKRAQGLVDFDDLIRKADQLLGTPGVAEWVRFKLDQQTDHILVDEAQDTNARQWQIVDALAGEYFAGEGAAGRHRTIFTVGDFKQAIFSFQGTDPREFERARAHFREAAGALRGNAEETGEGLPPDFLDLSMDRSFRSSAEVLEVVDEVIDSLGSAALGLAERPGRHVAHHDGRPGAVTLWQPFDASSESEEDGEEKWVGASVRLYAGRVAAQIKAWLDDPFRLACAGRPVRAEDILILVRSRSTLAGLIVARLHAKGVPVAGIDRLVLSAPLAVQDLLAAARFAVQPLDDLNLAALLVSPLIGWSQDDLFEAAFERAGALWPQVRGRPEAAALDELLGSVDYTTPYEFFERLLSGPIGGRARLLARLGREARDPIEELLASALEFETAGAPSLARFLDWFARGEVEIVRDPSAPLDAVRVMTVHGAKGLEAPVVILADACADPDKTGGGTKMAKLDLGDGLIVPVPRPRKSERVEPLTSSVAAADARAREEHWRLLYVAMTRAKERLYVGGALRAGSSEPPEHSWFTAVATAVEGLGGTWEEDAEWGRRLRFGRGEGGKSHPQPFHEGVAGHHPSTPLQPLREGPGVAPPTSPIATPLPGWLTRPAPQEEIPPRPLAPSAPGEDEAPYPPPSPELRAALTRGRLLHRLFERLPASDPATRRALADQWLKASGEAEEQTFRAALIADACRVIEDPAFSELFGPDALAEAPIAALIGGGQVVAGTVDRLIVQPGRVLIADFKTGARVPAAAGEAPPSHLRQMSAYRAALSVIFPGSVIETALLYTAGPVLHRLPDALLDVHALGAGG